MSEPKPVGYKRRADFNDMLPEFNLGIVNTELMWAKLEGNAEQIRVLEIEAQTLRDVIARLTPKPAPEGWKFWEDPDGRQLRQHQAKEK